MYAPSAPSAPSAPAATGSAGGRVPLSRRQATDSCFLFLFVVCSLLPQIALAAYTLRSGMKSWEKASAELPENFFQAIGCAMGISAACGLVFLQLLRCLPIRLAVYGGILASIGAIFALGVAISTGMLEEEAAVNVQTVSGTLAKIIAARGGELLLASALVGLLLVSCFWKEIQLSVAVLRSTSCFLGDAPSVPLLFPPLFGLVHLAGLCLWALAVLGAIELLQEEEGLGKELRERYFVQSGLVLLLCYFWGNGLVTALSSFATASVTAEWYFTPLREKSKMPPLRIVELLRLGLLKHGGSLALGSLLLALLRVLNFCLFWAGRNHVRSQDDSCPRRAFLRFRECAASCLEGFAKFASRQAYVEVAVSGCGFFAGAAQAARRAASAPKRFVAVESAAAMQRMSSQVLLVGIVGCAAAFLYAAEPEEEDLSGAMTVTPLGEGKIVDPGAPRGGSQNAIFMVSVYCFGAWLVAESILHPVSVVTSTILHCLLLDGGMPNASHAPLPLQQLMEAKVDEEAQFAGHYA